MKILQIITDRNLRGAQVFAAQLADHLAARGQDIILVSLYDARGLTAKIQTEKARNVELNGAKKALSFSLLRQVRDIIRGFEPDIIQANGSDTLKYAVLATRWLPRRPVLIYRNISMAGTWVHSGIQKWVYDLLFRQVDHVISLTEITRKEFMAVYHYPDEKISAIPIGVDVPETIDAAGARQLLSQAFDVPPVLPVLLHIGSFSKEKNQHGLLRIFNQVCKAVPALLVLIGDGPLRPEVMQTVSQMNRGDDVRVPGGRTDISDWMAGASALLLPSLVEGLPGVVLEAVAHRVPVVAYNVGAISEVIVDGESGYIVPAGDENAFVAKTITLLRREDKGASLGAAALEKIKRYYTLDVVTTAFERVYQKLISPK